MSDIDISRARFLRISDKPIKSQINSPPCVTREAPADFAEMYLKLGQDKVSAHYHTSKEKVAEWVHEAGLPWKPQKNGRKKNA